MINSRKIEDLHPIVQELCNKHIATCKAKGVIMQVTNTLRDAEYQDYLYAQGRTRAGSIVTNMQLIGPHGFGLAYDVVPIVAGKAVWDDDRLWKIIGEEGKKLGLTWGGDWKSLVDKPHFEYTGGLKAADLRAGKRPTWWNVTQALTLEEAIAVLQDHGIINSPDYWSQNAVIGGQVKGENAAALIIKTANELKRGEIKLAPAMKKGIVSATTLNIRNKPSTAGEVVDILKKNAEIDIFETSEDWYRIGTDRWVNSSYVNIV
jgi:peptidoglycan L-alanyl-D-glutamate endopeptidase CwlK